MAFVFFFQAEDGIRDKLVTGVQTCALPISCPVRPLVNHRREVIERRMSTPWVVPAFDEVEDGEARVGLRAEAFAIEQLALERREEALAPGVVVGIAHT